MLSQANLDNAFKHLTGGNKYTFPMETSQDEGERKEAQGEANRQSGPSQQRLRQRHRQEGRQTKVSSNWQRRGQRIREFSDVDK